MKIQKKKNVEVFVHIGGTGISCRLFLYKICVFVLEASWCTLLLICDPKLIRSILITDFQYFTDRDMYLNEKNEPLSAHLGALRGEQWREMRAKLTPAFAPNKIKMIFSVLTDCSVQLQKHLSKMVNANLDIDNNESIELNKMMVCLSANMVASIAFGLDVDCLAEPNHPFRNATRRVFQNSFKNTLRFLGAFFQPTLLKWSGLRFIDSEAENFLFNLVAKTLEMRGKNNISREDFFQLLIQLRNSDGTDALDGNEWKTITTNNKQKSLTVEQMAAQTFIFCSGGFERIAFTTSYCLYEIAKHPDIQQKIHAEIDRTMAKHNGKLTYESINELKYLECCIDGLYISIKTKLTTIQIYQFMFLFEITIRNSTQISNVTFE